MQGSRGPRVPEGEPHPNLLVCLYLVEVPKPHSKEQGLRPNHEGAWRNRRYGHLFGFQVHHDGFSEIYFGSVIRHRQECLDSRYGRGGRRVLEISDPKHCALYARLGHVQLHHDPGPVDRAVFDRDARCSRLAEADIRKVVLEELVPPQLGGVVGDYEEAGVRNQEPHGVVRLEVGSRE